MELTFVNQYDGSAPKRRRLAKACKACRARKKRCIHFAGVDKLDGEAPQSSAELESYDLTAAVGQCRTTETSLDRRAESGSGVSQHTGGSVVDTGASLAARSQPSPSSSRGNKRFFSDLNPEATFLDRTTPGDKPNQRPPNDNIGVWVDKREWEALVRQRDADAPNRLGASAALDNGLRNDQRPHSAVLAPLIDIYFEKIHPILPLIDESEFRESHADGLVPEPLVHALCLVAAKTKLAWPKLRLSASPETIPPREYCSMLHTSVMGALRAPCRYDKITLIQILALASLHSEGMDGPEEASMCLSQAMHHAQSLGIHLEQQSASTGAPDLSTKRLFWCLWALDQSNSAMNGRPIIMSDNDIATEPFAAGESGFPAFDAWLQITRLLSKIIDFYRPHKPMNITGWEDEYPGFEEIIDDVDGWGLPQSILMTLHFYYLTVAILSHRSRGVRQMPRGTHSVIRQRLCAGEVVRLMRSTERKHLHMLPFIPYAVSLALSVSYSHLRQSQIHHQQEEAREDFRACTEVLQFLRKIWSSAEAMATLAKKVLDELDRAPNLAQFRIPRKTKQSSSAIDNVANTQSTGHMSHGLEHGLSTNGMSTVSNENGVASKQGPANALEATAQQQVRSDGTNLFDGMDDIFGTYLDPNYPVDLSFVDDLPAFEWN